MKIALTASAAAILLSCAASVSQAAILAPGATLFPATPVAPVLTGLITSATGSFSVPGHFSGSVTVRVYNEGALNPLGGLTFVYSVTNDPAAPNAVERLTTNNFAGWLVDAGFDASTAGLPPTYISRDVPGDVPGFGWFSPAGVLPGTTSPLLILRTNAPAFTTDSVAVIDGATANIPQLLGPVSVPEPASLGLLGIGAAAMLRRRRR